MRSKCVPQRCTPRMHFYCEKIAVGKFHDKIRASELPPAMAIFIVKKRGVLSFFRSLMHPYRRIRLSDAHNASVALILESRNAPLSRISLLGCPKCERGAQFCIPKRTPSSDVNFYREKTWGPFLFPHSKPYPRIARCTPIAFCASSFPRARGNRFLLDAPLSHFWHFQRQN